MKFNFTFSKHCFDEMERRNISIEYIFEILQNPQQIVEGQFGRKIYQSIIVEENIEFLIRIVLDPRTKPFSVVTVYKTSKIDKYWRK